jgi:hypothetical protein
MTTSAPRASGAHRIIDCLLRAFDVRLCSGSKRPSCRLVSVFIRSTYCQHVLFDPLFATGSQRATFVFAAIESCARTPLLLRPSQAGECLRRSRAPLCPLEEVFVAIHSPERDLLKSPVSIGSFYSLSFVIFCDRPLTVRAACAASRPGSIRLWCRFL